MDTEQRRLQMGREGFRKWEEILGILEPGQTNTSQSFLLALPCWGPTIPQLQIEDRNPAPILLLGNPNNNSASQGMFDWQIIRSYEVNHNFNNNGIDDLGSLEKFPHVSWIKNYKVIVLEELPVWNCFMWQKLEMQTAQKSICCHCMQIWQLFSEFHQCILSGALT